VWGRHRNDFFGVQSGLTVESLVIGEANKNLFAPANPSTVGNFPGFKLGEMYRIYIEYFDAQGNQLNQGANELSEFATPMIKASPPQVWQMSPLPVKCLLCLVEHNCDNRTDPDMTGAECQGMWHS
jgi:hypothetical protein